MADPPGAIDHWAFFRSGAGATILFVLLTLIMTWPQAVVLKTHAFDHQDVFFNLWRLRWIAHALSTSPAELFNGNIFEPDRGVLAYSDAMLVEGVLAAPLLWAGVPPVLVHNLMLLGAIVASGVGSFVLARHLTGSAGGALAAGVIFAFAPYRFEHYMHMELQWAMWSPLAFLALHRAFDTGQWRFGLAVGACVALQMLSSIYYGMFLSVLIAAGAILLFARDRKAAAPHVMRVMAAGAVLAAIVCALYARPYVRTHERVGDRPLEELSMFRATSASYTSATSGNWLYGGTANRGGAERHLFPGLTPLFLMIAGLLLNVPGRRAIAYLLLLVAAFEMSFGLRGYVYSFLYDFVPPFRGLRAAARLGIFVLLFLGVLAGYGYASLVANRPRLWRMTVLSLCIAALLIEYRTTLLLAEYANEPAPIYKMLARQPRGIVAEIPAPRLDKLPGSDPEYAYMSTFHWFPIVNGYSGYYPASYLERLDRLHTFPSERAMNQLRHDNVRYVILHAGQYQPTLLNEIRSRIIRDGLLIEIAEFNAADGPAFLYRMR